MDALKLRLRAKDQLHPILQELVTGYAWFKGSKGLGRTEQNGWMVRLSPTLHFLYSLLYRLITLNGMKASDEITEEQSRQVGLAPDS